MKIRILVTPALLALGLGASGTALAESGFISVYHSSGGDYCPVHYTDHGYNYRHRDRRHHKHQRKYLKRHHQYRHHDKHTRYGKHHRDRHDSDHRDRDRYDRHGSHNRDRDRHDRHGSQHRDGDRHDKQRHSTRSRNGIGYTRNL